ncbi:MAG TPA: ArsA family ATPase [Lachnospiraceae bacterium]|nr:ArsA family ATPase [Lachnospiraceae bacterium]
MMRIILYTGKGGVGKTSCAAASAIKIAESGKKVLIMSTDMAHSLSDSFDVPLGKEPINLAPNLDAMEIDVVYESKKSWGNLKGYVKQLLTIQSGSSIETEELLVFPGMEELFFMFRILDFYKQRIYDVLIVDCAPTGETLSLLKYPEMFANFIEKVLPMKRKGVQIAGPVMEKVMKVPMPGNPVFDDIEYLMDKMRELQNLLQNKEVVSMRVVTTPEQIVIREAKRNLTCLHLYHYNVDAIIVNRIYPSIAMEGYFSKWMEMQKKGLDEINESFSEIPKFYLSLQKKELTTLPVLRQAALELFGETKIEEVLFCREIYKVVEQDGRKQLKILLPFAEKEELDIKQKDNEVIISIKNISRHFPLPKEFWNLQVASAGFKEGYLTLIFSAETSPLENA